MGYPKYDESATERYPGVKLLFQIIDMFFGIAFTTELIFKLSVLRLRWVLSYWNWFDMFIVLFWLVEALGAGSIPFPTMALRIARLARLFRLLRLVRKIQGFDAL